MINTTSLLNPASEALPVGPNIRAAEHANAYFQAKDIRRKARDVERNNVTAEIKENPMSFWLGLKEQCEAILSTSKDLEIACWLTEALLRLYQFKGLTAGFTLLNDLLNKYGLDLHPQDPDEGPDYCIQALAYLNGVEREGTLIMAIANVPLTQSTSHDNYSKWEYSYALKADNKALIDDITSSSKSTATDYYQSLMTDLNQSKDAFSALCDTLERLLQHLSPPSSYIKNCLIEFEDRVNELIGDRLLSVTDTTQLSDSNDVTIHKVGSSNQGQQLPLNRHSALDQLEDIAQFFAKTEPHSPVPYLLRRAIYWSNMNLSEFLCDIITDDAARQRIFELTGIQQPPGNESTHY